MAEHPALGIFERGGCFYVSRETWSSPEDLFGDLIRCVYLGRFAFRGYGACRSNCADHRQTFCLHCPVISAVPRYHCHSFPWSRPNLISKQARGPAATYHTLCRHYFKAFFMPPLKTSFPEAVKNNASKRLTKISKEYNQSQVAPRYPAQQRTTSIR